MVFKALGGSNLVPELLGSCHKHPLGGEVNQPQKLQLLNDDIFTVRPNLGSQIGPFFL